MTWSKRAIIEQAFDELALAGYNFDITPDEMQSAARRLDAQMATWASQGVPLPYAYGDAGSINIDAESGLPMTAIEAAYLALAVKTAASKGKALSQSTKAAAKAAFDALLSAAVREQTQQVQLASGSPIGAGHKVHTLTNIAFFQDPTTNALRPGGLALTQTGA